MPTIGGLLAGCGRYDSAAKAFAGVNFTALLAETIISSPVCGFLPFELFFQRSPYVSE